MPALPYLVSVIGSCDTIWRTARAVMLFHIDFHSPIPAYEQIMSQVIFSIASGSLEVGTLLIFKDDARQTARSAVHAQSSHIAAPLLGLLAAIAEVDEVAALPPALACEPNAGFNVGFIPRAPHAGGVQEQTTRLAVLQECSRRPRVQRIGARDGRRKIIENQAHR